MFSLNYRDSKPIYEQIKDQLKRLIVSGAMKKEERLPSVRELATGMSINPNTIQRAYRELEAEGYIYSIPGKGSFVNESKEGNTVLEDKALQRLKESLLECKYASARKQRVIELVNEIYCD